MGTFPYRSLKQKSILIGLSFVIFALVLQCFSISTQLFFCLSLYFIAITSGFLATSFLGVHGIFLLMLFSTSLFLVILLPHFFFFIAENNTVFCTIFKWFKLTSTLTVNFDIWIDKISYSFMLLTILIATSVNGYILTYFRYEANIERLFLFINSFVLSMVLLVISGNLVVLMLGWELIGLTSFVLINFWFTRATTFKSAFKAFTFNKFSDCALLLSFIAITNLSQTLDLPTIVSASFIHQYFNLNFFLSINALTVVTFLILTAAFIKSAQLGAHIWLPDSMEAPVPASALIHSATLVSAGIFLILRFGVFFENSPFFFYVAALVGATTAFVGGFSAVFQTDLKKILAYSTISHCGFLVFLSATQNVSAVLFYLFVHGIFKASSFLSAGNVIRFSNNYQDIRRMGGYWKYLPFDCFCLMFSLLNLSGLPFFFGFYSKHLLILANTHFALATITLLLLFSAALSGIFYSYRIIFYVFFDRKKNYKTAYLTYTHTKFNSKFFSFINLGGVVSITSLITLGYIIIFSLYHILINDTEFNNATFNFIDLTNDAFIYYTNTQWLFNMSFLNTILILCIYSLVYYRWTRTVRTEKNIVWFFFFTIVFFFAYIFCTII